MSSLSVYISLLKKVFLLRCYNNFRRGYFNILADKWPNASWGERKKKCIGTCAKILVSSSQVSWCYQCAINWQNVSQNPLAALPFISIWFQEEDGIKELFQGYMNCKSCIQTSFLVYIGMLNLQPFLQFFSIAKKFLGINFCLVIFDSCHYYLAKLCVLLSK